MPSISAWGSCFDEQSIFKSSRFAFVGVADQIFRLGTILGYETPLHAGGKPRAAAAAQAGGFDFIDQSFRLQGLDDLAPGAVAAPRLIRRQRVRARNADIAQEKFVHEPLSVIDN